MILEYFGKNKWVNKYICELENCHSIKINFTWDAINSLLYIKKNLTFVIHLSLRCIWIFGSLTFLVFCKKKILAWSGLNFIWMKN